METPVLITGQEEGSQSCRKGSAHDQHMARTIKVKGNTKLARRELAGPVPSVQEAQKAT